MKDAKICISFLPINIYATFYRLISIVGLLILGGTILMAGDPVDPTPIEKSTFESKLARLKSNMALHPQSVADAIASLEGTLMKTIECNETSELQKVIFNITTKQIKWDRNLMIDGEPAGVGATDIGFYKWTYAPPVIEDGMKIINACNYIMLDSAVMVDQEADLPYGPIGDEGLLYHELLHGQLVIDSIMNNPAYQEEVCNCNFDLAAGDFDHVIIKEVEEAYLEALLMQIGEEDPEAHIINPPAQAADEDGKFEIEIGDEALLGDKENISLSAYYPKGSNVMEGSIGILFKDGKIFITGMLIDKTKPGLLGVIIDPPGVFLFVGLEQAMLILPFNAAIPTLSTWSMLVLMLFMLIMAIVLLRERKVNVG